jgi:hypothetical protein
MKTMRAVSAILAFALGFAGCAKDNPVDTSGVQDVTDGRITIVNDEDKLNTRLIAKDDSVQVDSVATLKKIAAPQAFSMKLNVQISPPVVSGQQLQATSVSLSGSYAYISYNMVGNPYIGAIDVVQLNGSKSKIKSEATYTDTDVSSVFYFNNNVYMAEATGNVAYTSPAIAEVIRISGGGKLGLAGNLRSQLTSYVATSVAVGNGKVYVTTGNTGGLYALTQDSLKITSYTSLSDARWVDFDANYVAVVQGGGKLSVLSVNTGALLSTYSFTGTSIPESKSTVHVVGGKALIAAGDGGVKLMNLATGKIVGSIPRTIVAGLDSSLSVTNAVDGAGQYIYISNGEAGVYVAQSSQNLGNLSGDLAVTLTVLGKLRFSNLQSVNHVALSSDGQTLVVASGLGGVKIVTVSF